jgi:hypothetical protein
MLAAAVHRKYEDAMKLRREDCRASRVRGTILRHAVSSLAAPGRVNSPPMQTPTPMTYSLHRLLAVRFSVLAVVASLAGPASRGAAETVRFATFNLALYGTRAGEVLERLEAGADPQARCLAEIIQRVRPDLLVLNEIDYTADGRVLAAFCDKYLAIPQHASSAASGPAAAIEYPHRRQFATNTGVHSGLDLDRNGRIDATPGAADYAGDCWGYGIYPGQYAFALLSRFPLDEAAIREFRLFRWRDLPGAALPDDPATPAPADWYSADIADQFRLSSKNHCDVPLMIGERRVHLLLSHPTPPVFDGPEDKNGRRNHDELAFWLRYISEPLPSQEVPSAQRAGRGHAAGDSDGNSTNEADNGPAIPFAPTDDAGHAAPFPPNATFLIAGDLNGDPHDGDGPAGIQQLLHSPRVLEYPPPISAGAVEAAARQGGANARHTGDHAQDTEDAADADGPGNLRLDYLLPSADLKVIGSGVFWPTADDELAPLVRGAEHPASSDHRLVWIDVEL